MDDDGMNVEALLDEAIDGKKVTTDPDSKENTDDVGASRERRSRSGSEDRSKRKRSSSRDRSRRSSSRDRRRRRSRSGDRDRKRRSRSRDRDRRRSRSRSRDRRRSRSRSRDRRRRSPPRRPRVIDHRDRRSPRRSPPRGGRFGGGRLPGPERRDVMPFTAKSAAPRGAKMDLTAEERDHRTLFILQIARLTRPRDLEEFFSSVGSVRDVRIITDSRTGRSKGIAYVEFWEEESVPLGLALNGQKLLGAPLVIQRTCAERNRAANATSTVGSALGFGPANSKGPCKVLVQNVHPNINETMLESIFEPFGRIEKVKMSPDIPGNVYITFTRSEDGAKAAEQLNGFDLADNNIRVSLVDEEDESIRNRPSEAVPDREAAGIAPAPSRPIIPAVVETPQEHDPSVPSIATACFMLSNMFDPLKETEDGWDLDVKADVLEECAKNGGALHVYVDKASAEGNVYVKCPTVLIAHKSVSALHGRWFSGKVITANYVPVDSYHSLFPESVGMTIPIIPRPPGAPVPPMMPPMPPGFIPPPGFPGMPPMPPPGGFPFY